MATTAQWYGGAEFISLKNNSGDTITGRTFVSIDLDTQYLATPSANARNVGVLISDCEDGEYGKVLLRGTAQVTVATGTTSPGLVTGNLIKTDANGTATSTSTEAQVVGVAVSDGTATNPIWVKLF